MQRRNSHPDTESRQRLSNASTGRLLEDTAQLRQDYLKRAKQAWRSEIDQELESSAGRVMQETCDFVDSETSGFVARVEQLEASIAGLESQAESWGGVTIRRISNFMFATWAFCIELMVALCSCTMWFGTRTTSTGPGGVLAQNSAGPEAASASKEPAH